MRLPLAAEIAAARVAVDDARDAVKFVFSVDRALTAARLAAAGVSTDTAPSWAALAEVRARFPAIPPAEGDQPAAVAAALARARAYIGPHADALAHRDAQLSGLIHDQSHLAMDPTFDDLLIRLAELDAVYQAAEAELELPAHKIQWLRSCETALEACQDALAGATRPDEDPLGNAAYQAASLASSVGTAAADAMKSLGLGAGLLEPPSAPEDDVDADTAWADLDRVRASIAAVLAVVRHERADAEAQIADRVAKRDALVAQIREITG